MKIQKKGFTLIEIMIVVATIGLLSAIAVPNFQQSIVTARTNSCLNNLRTIDVAKDQFALDCSVNQGITPVNSDLDPYIRGGIQLAKQCPLEGEIAINPIGGSIRVVLLLGTPYKGLFMHLLRVEETLLLSQEPILLLLKWFLGAVPRKLQSPRRNPNCLLQSYR